MSADPTDASARPSPVDRGRVHELLGLSPTADAGRWTVDVHEGVQTGSGALHGGCAFGAAVEAMVAGTGRPLVWATTQFIAHAAAGTTLDLEVDIVATGHRVSQARARLLHRGEEVACTLGAFGTRPFEAEHLWAAPLDVAPPQECAPRAFPSDALLARWQARVATGRPLEDLDGTPGPGRSGSWYRLPHGPRLAMAGDLAVLGDFTMLELSDAMGAVVSGNSLDNTLRVASVAECDWILVETQWSVAAHGFASVTAHLWSESGTLLGIASQTLVLRSVGTDGRPVRTTKRFAGERTTGANATK